MNTLFVKNSNLNLTLTKCGYFNRSKKKISKLMKKFCEKNKLQHLTFNEFDNENLENIFTFKKKPKSQNFFDFKTKNLDEFEIGTNLNIIKKENQKIINQFSSTLPLLHINETLYKKTLTSYMDEKGKVIIKENKEINSFNFQLINYSLNGIHILHPWRNRGTLNIIKGYEKLFPNTNKILKEVNYHYKEFIINEDIYNNHHQISEGMGSLIKPCNMILEDFEAYHFLMDELEDDYLDIKNMGYSEFLENVDEVFKGKPENQLWFRLIQSMKL